MRKIFFGEARRKLTLAMGAALFFTLVFQDLAWAQTDEQAERAGRREEYKIYLQNIKVEGDNREEDNYQQDFEGAVSGGDIYINGKSFQISQQGKIIDTYGNATVSGNDLYILASQPQVEINYGGDKTYFEASGTVSGNEGASLVLQKKHFLSAKVLVAVREGENMPALDAYPDGTVELQFTNGQGDVVNPQAVRKTEGPFHVVAELYGVQADAEAVLDDNVDLVYRGYAEYGRDMELWDGANSRIETFQEEQYYNVSGIVIKGHEISSENPFGTYELMIGGKRMAGSIGREDTYITMPTVSGGDAFLTLHMENVKSENLGNNTLRFLVDNTPPVMEKVTWTTDRQPVEMELEDDSLLVDSSRIDLIVEVEEEHLDTVGLYCLEDGREVMIEEQKGEGRLVFTLNSDAYNYKPLFFKMVDKAGNTGYYGRDDGANIRVIIDLKGPQLQEFTYVYPEKNGWYRNQQIPLQYAFTFKDYSEIHSVGMTAALEDGTSMIWDLTDDCRLISERDEDGYYTYQIITGDDRFSNLIDQNCEYCLVLEDVWKNTNMQNRIRMLVDNTAPSPTAYIKFQGDHDRFYNALDELVEMEDKPYQYGSFSGKLFNNSQVDMTVYVADFAAPDAVGQAASGVKEVKVTYHYTEKSLYAEKEYMKVLTYSDGNTENAVKALALVQTGDEAVLMNEICFRLQVSNSQQITSIESIEVKDAAGNVTVIREYANANGLNVDYILDNKAPELSHVIPGGSGYNKDANTYYYNASNTDVAVTIAENNFYPREVVSNLRVGTADKTITMEGFQDLGNYNYRSRFSLEEGDGTYRFALAYTDRSGNALIYKDGSNFVTEGTYTSPILVLDTLAPVLNINYYRNGQNITDSMYAGNCINGDVTAVISVTEKNFDPDLVQIVFRAANASDNGEINLDYNPSDWSRDGDTYSYSIPCNTEGRYSLTASCVDKAGNSSGSAAASDFIVDKTAPMVGVVYNTTVESGYYNVDRTADITVTDQNFDAGAAEYVITSSGMQPIISPWVHMAAGGCDGSAHVKGCQWTSQIVFGEDADYFFTFNCVDKAQNPSLPITEEAFTVDQTRPAIRVHYDNEDVQNGYYFSQTRRATVTITEHNFDSDAVNMSIRSADGERQGPIVWQDRGMDVYQCEIPYDVDGDFTFAITCTDLAGNEAEAYADDHFVVDMTPPELEISGILDRSANNGVVAPMVTFSDQNYDAEMVSVQITGVNHGAVEPEHTVTAISNGQTITFTDFAYTQETDDLYTLEAAVTDRAGNVTEKSVLFSVNRFGSVYLLDEATQELLDRFYTNQGPDLTITEINVDTLEHQEISYSCDGDIEVLKQGIEYTVQESGSEQEWKEYTYHIAGSNFESEGVYVVTIQSVDRASNDTTNRLKESNIEFTVDKTAPSVVIGGIENGGSYAETSRKLTIDAMDNIYLTGLEVYLNSELVASYGEDELTENYGVVSCEIRERENVQTLYVVARDAAGNKTQTDMVSFLITSNVFIRWFYNRPLFIGSIACAAAVAGGISILIFRKRRKKNSMS